MKYFPALVLAAAGGSAPLASSNRAGAEAPGGGMSNGAWHPTALRCEP